MPKNRGQDLLVLKELRNNSRVKHTSLSRKHGWPVSTAHGRIRRCEDRYITRHVALLRCDELGLQRTFWVCKPSPHDRESWLSKTLALPFLNNLSRTHDSTFIIETLTRDSFDLKMCEEALSGAILKSRATKTVFQERFLTE